MARALASCVIFSLGCVGSGCATTSSSRLPPEGEADKPPVQKLRQDSVIESSEIQVDDEVRGPVERGEAEPTPSLRDFTGDELERMRRVQPIVMQAAEEFDVDPKLINAVIWVESKFEPRVRGRRGPKGLMQLMPRTGMAIARTLHKRYKPYDPKFNIQAGAYYLARMLRLFRGDVQLALAAYNAGPALPLSVRDSGEPLPPNIQRYVDKVMQAMAAFAERDVN